MEMTREQKLAYIKDRHLIVNANAGSGKTSVLVGKYLDLVLDFDNPLSPKDIVAITFTEAAANEMRVRLIHKIDEYLKEGKYDESNLNKIKREIFSARISTIHSFCNGIIKNYPIEAGFSPNSKLIDAFNKKKLIDESKEIVLESIFENYDISKLDYNINYTDFNSSKVILQYLFLKGNKSTINSTYDNLNKKSFESLLNLRNEINDYYLGNKTIDITFIIDTAKCYSNLLLDYRNTNMGKDDDNRKFDQIITFADKFLLSIDLNSNINDRISQIQEFVRQILSIKFGNAYINSRLFKVTSDIECKKSETLFAEIRKLEKIEFDYNQLTLHFKLSLALLDYIIEVKKVYNDSKMEMEFFEFDDLIEKVFEVFKDEETLKIIQNEIKYLLIDEFQDTDPKQYDIITKLIPNLVNHSKESITKLFIVGDEKQGIYGFRNADIKIFKQIRKDIIQTNQDKSTNESFTFEKENIVLSVVEAKGDILLSESFRLKPALAGFINNICKPLFENISNEYSVNYDNIICGREKETFLELSQQNQSKDFNKYIGSITILNTEITDLKLNKSYYESEKYDVQTSEKLNEESSKIQELDSVSNLIKYIISSEEYQIPDKNGQYHNAKYSDIAILYRGEGDIKLFSKAFIKANIPYSINKSIVAANLQEIIDLISYMKVLINSQDDISLVSLLKSPFFNFTYVELIDLSFEIGTNYFEKLENCSRTSSNLGLKSQIAYNIINETIILSKRLPIYLLISRMIEKSNYYQSIKDFPNADVIKFNLEFAIEHAIAYEKRGFTNLESYVDELNSIKDEELESDLVKKQLTNDNLNCVTVTTIHGSKGLEYPIVIILKAGVDLKGMPDYEITPTGTSQRLCEDIIQNDHLDFLKSLYKDNIAIKVNEENKRLLYVAMTRAKEHLIISSKSKYDMSSEVWINNNSKNSFFDMINQTLEIDIEKLCDYDEFYIKSKIKTSSKDNGIELEIPIKVVSSKHISSLLNQIDTISENKKIDKYEEMSKKLKLIEDYNETQTNQIFSATKLMIYKKDISLYKDRYFYGLPSINFFQNNKELKSLEDTEKKDDINGAEFGTIIHSLLEKINTWFGVDAVIDSSKLNELINQELLENNEIPNDNNRNNISDYIEIIANHPFIKENSKNIWQGVKELQLDMPIGDDFITGSIDLLLKNSEGEYEIWDWKTNFVNTEIDLNEYRIKYEDQLKLYAYMVSLLYPKQKTYKSKLLFTRIVNSKYLNWIQSFEWDKEELELYFDLVAITIDEINAKKL